MTAKPNYEKLQVVEQKETNFVLWINTVATIVSAIGGLASLYIAYVAFKLMIQ